ncbi:MAG: DUF4412 domain-containing protein [Fermentimonas sp.]|nr:DUF4412 domain-containing protein [Fermentimonas sp.]
MKIVKLFILFSVTFAFGFVNSANAQFLNRLKNKVLESAENVVVDKAADKAAEKTADAMDKVLNPNMEGLFNMGGKSVDLSQLPEAYHFDYDYTLKMSSQGEEMRMNYLFNKNEPYIGIKTEASPEMVMILDSPKNTFIIKSDETVIAREFNTDNELNEDEIDENLNYTFSELPDREFLGYNCKGFQMENEENKIIVYFAPEIDVRFGNTEGQGLGKMSKEMKAFAKKYENGLMMYMEMDDKLNKSKNNDSSMTMECVSFEESSTDVRIR